MTMRSRAIGRISPYRREYSSSPYTARVPAISFDGSTMCGAPRGCTTAVAFGSSRMSAPGAAGVIQVHVGQEEVVDRIAFDAELRQRAQYQRYGRARAGVDDGGP